MTSQSLINDHFASLDASYARRGVFLSIIFHVLLVAVLVGAALYQPTFELPPVYSVTIEGGKSLGGRSQVAKDDKKTPLAPPKNASDPVKQQPVETKKEEVIPIKPVEKKEVPKEVPKKEEVPVAKKEVVEPKKAPPPKVEPKKEPPKEDVNKEYQKTMQRYLGESSDAGGQGFGAAKVGGQGMGGGELKPREFFIYSNLIKAKIESGWNWYDNSTSILTIVEFSISPQGQVSGERVVQSSGNMAYDESVVRAVRAASPLPPPPAIVYNDFRIVQMRFDPRNRG